MQVIKNVVRSRVSFKLTILGACFLSLTLSSCEDPGSVGGSFSDIGSEVVIDTLEIGQINTDSVEAFSGKLRNFTAGWFNDPLFGEVTATALLRPTLASSSSTIEDSAEVVLKLMINKDGVYGDSLSTAEFSFVEIDQIWRGNAWKLNQEVPLSAEGPLSSFSIGEQDSIEIPLPSQWVSEYRSFVEDEGSNRDSLYRYESHGLALVPQNQSKILPFLVSGSEILVYNPGEEDTLNIGFSDWAYSLQRSGAEAAPEGNEKLMSTLENLLFFDLDLSPDNLGTVNIAKVDLVFYQNEEVLSQTINEAGPSARRPENVTARLHYINPEHASSVLDPGNPIALGEYDASDQAFHFNITSYVNSVLIDNSDRQPDKRFYIQLQTNDGVVRSSLLYDHEAPANKRPKLIVTSTKSEGN